MQVCKRILLTGRHQYDKTSAKSSRMACKKPLLCCKSSLSSSISFRRWMMPYLQQLLIFRISHFNSSTKSLRIIKLPQVMAILTAYRDLKSVIEQIFRSLGTCYRWFNGAEHRSPAIQPGCPSVLKREARLVGLAIQLKLIVWRLSGDLQLE